MTREEASNQINDIKTELAEHLLKKDIEALDMAVSALSGGEYIKKSELLQHVVTEELSDYKDCDVIHAEEIDELTTYSIPPVATINVPEEKIQEFIHSKANVVSSESSDSAENKGEWIKTKDQYETYHFTCSKCGNDIATKSDAWNDNFCSECGADMRGET